MPGMQLLRRLDILDQVGPHHEPDAGLCGTARPGYPTPDGVLMAQRGANVVRCGCAGAYLLVWFPEQAEACARGCARADDEADRTAQAPVCS